MTHNADGTTRPRQPYRHSLADSDEEDTYTIPLQDQRVFGAGIKRKRIAFVPGRSEVETLSGDADRVARGLAAASRYAEIVSPKTELGRGRMDRGVVELDSGSGSGADSGARFETKPSGLGETIGDASATAAAQMDENKRVTVDDVPVRSATVAAHIPSSSIPANNPTITATTATEYRSMSSPSAQDSTIQPATSISPANLSQEQEPSQELCPICHLPLTLTHSSATASSGPTTTQEGQIDNHSHLHHATLLAHQLSLPHQHAPSSLDRRRMGARYLASYGWDPDSREGLGAQGQGSRFPVKTVMKNDTVGLGMDMNMDLGAGVGKKEQKEKKKKLNAKEARSLAEREKRLAKDLSGRVFGMDEDVERVLNGR